MENISSKIEKVTFLLQNGNPLETDNDLMKELGIFLSTKYGRKVFQAGELMEDWSAIQPRIHTIIPAEMENFLSTWMIEGGNFEIYEKSIGATPPGMTITQSQVVNNTSESTENKPNFIQKNKRYIIAGGCIFVVLTALYFLFSRSNIVQTPIKSTQSGDIQAITSNADSKGKIDEVSTSKIQTEITIEPGSFAQKEITGTDAKLIGTFQLSGEIIPEWYYYFDGKLAYSVTDGKSQNTLQTTFYDAENNKIIDTEDSIVIHDMRDGKITYERKDADKNGYLYIDDTLVSTNIATVDKFGDTYTIQSNPFQFKKIGENYIYFTYSGSSNTGGAQAGNTSSYSVNVNGNTILDSFITLPKVYILNNDIYTIGFEKNSNGSGKGLKSLYKNSKKIATSTSTDFWLRKIGDTVGFQTNENGTFKLYLGEEKIAEQEGVSINFMDIEGKIAYDIYDITTNQTLVYWGDEEIVKVKLTRAQNGLQYGSKNGKFYYSYSTFLDESGNKKDKDRVIYDEKTYEDISSYKVISDIGIAYKKMMSDGNQSELYLNDELIASGAIVQFGEMNKKLYYTTYDKESKLYAFYFDGNMLHTSTENYYFTHVKNGMFYSIKQGETDQKDAYINDQLIASGIESSGLLYIFMPYEGENMENIETLAYTKKEGGEYVLHGMDGAITLKSGEKIASIANDRSKFYIRSKENGKTTISVYQIQ